MGSYDLNQCLSVEAANWKDSEEYAVALRDRFTAAVDADYELLAHRLFIEKHAYGMGERCFHWMWKLIVDQMPREFSFLEIGVYKGQVLSLVRLLANRSDRKADVVGVTMLSDFAGVTGKFTKYPDEDYRKYITDLHDRFALKQPCLIVGDSTNPDIQEMAAGISFEMLTGDVILTTDWPEPMEAKPYDIVYIDGCHEYDYVVKDLLFYAKLIKVGGLLVVDDASNYLKQPFGFFQGIEDVSRAVRTVIETDPQWEHLLAVVHNRVWRRKV